MADQLLVAKKTFITEVDGKRVRVVKDKTRIRTGHPLVKGREELFKPADVQYDVEDVTARPGSKRAGRRTTKTTKTAEQSSKSDDSDKD